MGILRVNNLEKSFGIEELFHEVSFTVARGDKAGLIGSNGAGKTTLLRCIMGQEEYDSGEVSFDTADTIGYVEQQADFREGSLHEEFTRAFADIQELSQRKQELEAALGKKRTEGTLSAYGRVVERFEQLGGYDYESRLRKVAFGLGFTEDDFQKRVNDFSGGQKTRICLAKALMREPDFLFLDEPTNHLDIEMTEWLEEFLRAYPGGILLISHDRFFLDRVTTQILDLDGRTVTVYAGNYSYSQKVKEERRAALDTAYAKQQAEIKRTQDYILKYKAGIKAKQARGREKKLERLTRVVLPPEQAAFNYFAFAAPQECAQRVLELEDVSFSFGQDEILSHLSLLIRKGDGVALVGANGAGKTTLLRLIVGELALQSGRMKIGSRVKVGYFSQQHEGLHPENTLLAELQYEYGLDEERARQYLGAFLFTGDESLRLVGELSGGEQSRLAFLKLMLTGANFLVLDEPTNHLDIPAKEAIEEALLTFPGTFLAVSHDRFFLDKVANCTLELSEGLLTEYGGNYSYYRQKKIVLAEALSQGKGKNTEKERERKKASPKAERRNHSQAAGREVLPERNTEALRRCEAEIAMAEVELKGLEYEMNEPSLQQNPERSRAIAAAYADKEAELSRRYEKWEQLAED